MEYNTENWVFRYGRMEWSSGLRQNKMAAIAMDSEGNKVGRAKDALRELLVPEAEWGPWIEAFDE